MKGKGLRFDRAVTKAELLVALLVIVVVGPLVHGNGAQQASRYAFTAAMWDMHTFRLYTYAELDPPVLFIDRSVRDGHTYSDKAPLQPMIAVPFYASFRAVGGEPATVARYRENLGIWWITFWTATVPGALLAMLMYRMGRRLSPEGSLPATLAVFFGSILFPFSAVLFGHVLAALLVFGAFSLLMGEKTSVRVLGAGALAGAAVAAEYTTVLAVVVLAALAIWLFRARSWWYFAGGVPAAAFLGWYHSVAFGSPLNHPYRYSAFNEVTQQARGIAEIFSSIHLDHALAVFMSWRGFVLATPIVIVALVGLVVAARSKSADHRVLSIVSLAMFIAFLMIPVFWANPWGGASPGSRYMTPAFPFLVVGSAALWVRSRLWGIGAALISVLTMTAATITSPLLGGGWDTGLGRWIVLASDGQFVPTLFTMLLGPIGWIFHGVAVGGVVWALLRANPDHLSSEQVAATAPG